MVKLQYTTASAVKEKEGKLLCQPEVLCDSKTKTCIAQCSVKFVCLYRHSKYISPQHFLSQYTRVDFVVQSQNVSTGVELPRINYDFNGKKYRFVYMTCVAMTAVATKVKVPVI